MATLSLDKRCSFLERFRKSKRVIFSNYFNNSLLADTMKLNDQISHNPLPCWYCESTTERVQAKCCVLCINDHVR